MNQQKENRIFALFQEKMFRVNGVHLTNLCIIHETYKRRIDSLALKDFII